MNNTECGNKSNVVLNPNFVTGLIEAEGCFSVGVFYNKKAKFKRNVKLEFTIKMLENETELLTMVELFFYLLPNIGIIDS
jgi:peptide deformylase